MRVLSSSSGGVTLPIGVVMLLGRCYASKGVSSRCYTVPLRGQLLPRGCHRASEGGVIELVRWCNQAVS